MVLNHEALAEVALWWTAWEETAKTVPIDPLREDSGVTLNPKPPTINP